MKCEVCGKEFVPNSGKQRYCSNKCATAIRNRRQYAQDVAIRNIVRRPKTQSKNPKTLAQWCREADECNLDYGNYRALIEHGGKTFEELRAQAANRCVQIHAHGRVHSTH